MIKKRNLTNGVNANVSLEPSSAAQSNSNINNNIYITKHMDSESPEKDDDVIITREVQLEEVQNNDTVDYDVKLLILETFAKILLDQDKALISNLIFKNCIIIPVSSLTQIIKTMIKDCEVEIYLNEDIKCCATKANPIRKVDAIKVIKNNGEVLTDFKQVYNKEYNDLVNVYHICLKHAVNM